MSSAAETRTSAGQGHDPVNNNPVDASLFEFPYQDQPIFSIAQLQHANLSFAAVLSEAGTERHRQGFVTDAVAADLAALDGWKAYVAGPPAMVDAAMSLALARGLRSEDMHADVFFTPERQWEPGAVP